MRPIFAIDVKGLLRTPSKLWLTCVLFIATGTANAGPFGDFFKALRRSISHPEQKSHARQNSRVAGAKPSSHDVPSVQNAASPVNGPPSHDNVRVAKPAPPAKREKIDLVYGTPVPGKKGFVISPFAPDSGYVDVREFSPGTEVKDPYTGKIFLTP
jgi:hypothetical protein